MTPVNKNHSIHSSHFGVLVLTITNSLQIVHIADVTHFNTTTEGKSVVFPYLRNTMRDPVNHDFSAASTSKCTSATGWAGALFPISVFNRGVVHPCIPEKANPPPLPFFACQCVGV